MFGWNDMNLDQQFDKVLYRHDEVSAQLASGDTVDSQSFVRLSKELSELTPVADAIRSLFKARAEMTEAEAMMADPDMKAMAEEE